MKLELQFVKSESRIISRIYATQGGESTEALMGFKVYFDDMNN